MNKEEFYKLPKEAQDFALEEMLELRKLIDNYPIGIDELKIFTEWHKHIVKFGDKLNNFLIGIYPYNELNNKLNMDELTNLLKLSNDALSLVQFWNRIIRRSIMDLK